MFCCVAGAQETTTVRMFEWVNAINEVAAESRGQFFLRDRLGGAHTLETADEGACAIFGCYRHSEITHSFIVSFVCAAVRLPPRPGAGLELADDTDDECVDEQCSMCAPRVIADLPAAPALLPGTTRTKTLPATRHLMTQTMQRTPWVDHEGKTKMRRCQELPSWAPTKMAMGLRQQGRLWQQQHRPGRHLQMQKQR